MHIAQVDRAFHPLEILSLYLSLTLENLLHREIENDRATNPAALNIIVRSISYSTI